MADHELELKVRYSALDDDANVTTEPLPIVEHQQNVLINYNTSPDESDQPDDAMTVADAIEHIGVGRFQLMIVIITGLMAASDALEIMLLAVLAPVLKCEWLLDDFQVAMITTVVFLGYLVMAPIWGALSDRYGRRNIVTTVAIWIAFYGFLTTFSPTYNWVLALRCCVGLGMAGAIQGFILSSEYVPIKWRAVVLTGGSSIFWTIGSLFEIALAAAVLPNISNDSAIAGWRILVLVSSIPIAVVCLILRWLPESARYLVTAGRKDEAKALLDHAARMNGKPKISRPLKAEPDDTLGDIRELFRSGLATTTLGCWALWFTAAFAYYGMILMSAVLLSSRNQICDSDDSIDFSNSQSISDRMSLSGGCTCELPTQETYISMLVSTLGEFASVVLNFFTLDRLGRKKSMALYLAIEGVTFVMLIPCGGPIYLTTALVFIIRGLSSAFFNGVYVYVAEVYPTRIRSLGIGTSSSAARIGALLTPFVAQVLFNHDRTAALVVYCLLSFVAAVVCLLMPIESKDRQLAT